MDPDYGTALGRCQVSDTMTHSAHGVMTVGIPFKKARVHLQFIILVAIACFSMAASINSALRLTWHIQHFNFRQIERSVANKPVDPSPSHHGVSQNRNQAPFECKPGSDGNDPN